MVKQTNEEKKLKQVSERIALKTFDEPTETHEFSDTYNKRKEELLKKVKKSSKKTKKSSTKKLFLAAAAALFIIPSTVYAANELYQWIVKQNDYKVTLSVDNQSTNETNNNYYKLKLDYLPDDMVPDKNADDKYSYKDNLSKGGLSFLLWKVQTSADFDVLYSEDTQEATFNNHRTLIVNKTSLKNEGFTKEVFVLFEKEGYVLQAYVGNDVPKEDLTNILSHLSLKESSKEEASTTVDFNDYKERLNEPGIVTPEVEGLPANSSNIHHIGDTVSINIPNDPEFKTKINYTINSVEVFDSIHDYQTENFQDFSLEILKENQLVNKEGQLLPFNQRIISRGNGDTTIDKVESTQQMTPKFVFVTAEIENPSNQPISDLMLQNAPQLLENKDGNWFPVSENKEVTAYTGEVDYLDAHGEGSHFYHLPTISAKEKLTIHYGFFVDQDQLSKLFLPVFYYDNFLNLNQPNLNFYDIRQ